MKAEGHVERDWNRLTVSERRIVALTCEGLTNPQIGQRLSISPRTVKRHLYEVFRKLGVSSRTQLVAEAVRAGYAVGMSETPER